VPLPEYVAKRSSAMFHFGATLSASLFLPFESQIEPTFPYEFVLDLLLPCGSLPPSLQSTSVEQNAQSFPSSRPSRICKIGSKRKI